ncbi:MAG: hypothetical protein KF774_12410 [Planctomyces sp.]|nr:hypothetical protein [Planctomyces sp.]
MTPRFHYYDGSPVRIGDRIYTGNVSNGKAVEGVVELIISPGSEDADAYSCPEGGILICEQWGDNQSLLLMTPPDGIEWEDLVLIERSPQPGN